MTDKLAAEGLVSSPSVDLENQRRQLDVLGLLGEFAPSCDLADHLGEALLKARALIASPASQEGTILLEWAQRIVTAPELEPSDLERFAGTVVAYLTKAEVSSPARPEPLNLEPIKARFEGNYARFGVNSTKAAMIDVQWLLAEVERLAEGAASLCCCHWSSEMSSLRGTGRA